MRRDHLTFTIENGDFETASSLYSQILKQEHFIVFLIGKPKLIPFISSSHYLHLLLHCTTMPRMLNGIIEVILNDDVISR